MTGAASCFYAFISFDIIATASEETKEPCKTIPMAIIATVSSCFALYFGIAVAITLTFPWNKLEIEAPLARAYEARKIFGFEYVVGVGALFGLTAGLFAAMFPIPRILYSMGSDGLLFKFLAHVNAQSQTPLPACIISGVLASTVALIFRLDLLVELLSIGILAAYSLVSLAVLCLRYQNGIVGLYNEYEDPNDIETTVFAKEKYDKTDTSVRDGSRVLHVMDQHTFIRRIKEDDPLCIGRDGITTEIFMKHQEDRDSKSIFESGMKRESTYHRMNSLLSNSSLGSVLQMSGDAPTDPNDQTWRIVSYSLVAYILSIVCVCVLLTAGRPYLIDSSWWAITLLCLLLLVVLTSIVFISKQPQNNTKLYFKVPYVPFVPLTSLALNSLMIASLPQIAWVRFAIWMLIGKLSIIRCSNINKCENKSKYTG